MQFFPAGLRNEADQDQRGFQTLLQRMNLA